MMICELSIAQNLTAPRGNSISPATISMRSLIGPKAYRLRHRVREAFTIMEMMVTTAISVFVMAAVMTSFVVMSRSFAAIGNYTDLDSQSRSAMDTMARDIRQCGHLTNWTATTLMFTNLDGQMLNYTYQTNTHVLSYTNGSTGRSAVLLSNCVALTFSIFQRTPTNGPVSFYTASNAVSAKGILMSFTCLRTNYLSLTDSETVETASIVLRN